MNLFGIIKKLLKGESHVGRTQERVSGGCERKRRIFIRSMPSSSEPYLISAAFECLKEHVPMNEAEILGRCRRIRYAKARLLV